MAGKRRGSDDPRHLWPHVARIIGEVVPPFVFLENVAHHLRLGFPRSRQRTGRHGLQNCGGPLHGGGSRGAPQAGTALHPRPPRARPHGRPRAPAPGPAPAVGTGPRCSPAGRPRWRATATSRARASARRPT
ncbi:DNA cytosine methyltransferase [Jhaorihella thermophila]